MKFNPTDVSCKAWLLRWAMGPAAILDGVVSTLAFGTIWCGCTLAVSRALAAHRLSLMPQMSIRGHWK